MGLKNDKIIVIAAPSGAGKTTMVKRLLTYNLGLEFSISACTRHPRVGEVDGKDYYFFDEERFKGLMDEDAFVEWEMVYAGKYYGTLRSELDRILDKGNTPLVDIDVKGAMSVMDKYKGRCLSIFIKPPSTEELKNRLIGRGTETEETLAERINKAELELSYAHGFDKVIINDDLERASAELLEIVRGFVKA